MNRLIFLSLAFVLTHFLSFGQTKTEDEIRRLEILEIQSIFKANTTTLLKLWSKD